MNADDQSKPKTPSCPQCRSTDDENNNFSHSICTSCEHSNPSCGKESERMIVIPDTSSDDEHYCSSCSSVNDSELISLDTRKLWHDTAHLIKCIYRESNRDFAENHSPADLCTVKEYVQILAQFDSEALFNKVESIVLEYVDEIRNQVLKRFQACLKTSNDVQLFISYLLDEYNTFIQAAKNVSAIVSYLEEHYLKAFHLTWLLYNKHLYEKLVYMDKKIQHSMSKMIDLLQPTNDEQEYCSPAEYTQLLNRFLAFDEEMSEIACLYKDCQAKMNSTPRSSFNSNRNPVGVVVTTNKKKRCKKIKKTQALVDGNMNSTTTSAVNIPLSNNSTSAIAPSQQGSNGSSIGSGVGGKESSSVSSFDDYLLDNNTSSSSFTKEEPDPLLENNNTDLHNQLFHGILNNLPPTTPTPSEIEELQLNENTTTTDTNEEKPKAALDEPKTKEEKPTSNGKKSKSSRRKDSSTTASKPSSSTLPKPSLTPDLILPPKPPSSTTSRLQADLRSLTIPSLGKTELAACPSLLSAKMQSVSFTAGTFASIRTEDSPSLTSASQPRLNLNLSRKAGFLRGTHEQFLRQHASPNELAALLSSMQSAELTSDSAKSSIGDQSCDFCCCDLLSDSSSSVTHGCAACMSLPANTTFTCAFNPRSTEMRARIQLKAKQSNVSNSSEQSKPSSASKTNMRQCDNNIDDLVRFIDGDDTTAEASTPKKSKKKKDKQAKSNPSTEDGQQKQSNKVTSKEPVVEVNPPLSKRKQKAKLKLEQQEKPTEPSSTIPSPPLPPAPLLVPPEKIESLARTTASSAENCPSPEEEVNWITISRKQTKHKPAPAPSLPPPTKSKKPPLNPKSKPANTSTLAQPKVMPEIVSNSNKQSHITPLVPPSVPNSVKSHPREKADAPSAWTKLEPSHVTTTSTLLATAPVFVPASSLVTPSKPNDTLPLNDPAPSSLSWSTNDYLSSDSTQQPLRSFLPAPGPLHTTVSRCIQRPTSEPRTTPSFPSYSPMNYIVGHATCTWDNVPITNSNESQWKESREEPFRASTTIPNDFPLYDPFKSGAALTIPTSILHTDSTQEHSNGLLLVQDNDVDEMNALEKEIEDLKKYYMEDSPGAVSTHIPTCFRQS